MESCKDNPGYDPLDPRDAPEPDDYDPDLDDNQAGADPEGTGIGPEEAEPPAASPFETTDAKKLSY